MFDEYVAVHARSQPDAPAVITLEREISFAKFDADIDRAAALLAEAPLEGETVAVAVRDEYLTWVAVLALARLGVASAPSSDRDAPFRVSDQAGEEGTLHLSPERILHGPAAQVTPVRRDPDTVARVMFTSGTTGFEKKIALSWRAIDSNLASANMPQGPRLIAMGLDVALGLMMPMGAWAGGNAVILGTGGRLTPEFLTLRPVLVGLVPDQLRRLLDNLPSDFVPMPEMRLLLVGGVVPPALAKETRRRLTPDLVSAYGTSECGLATMAPGAVLEEKPGAAGYALPGVEVEVVDAADEVLPRGTRGHIRIRNDRLVSGYLNDPARTAEAFRDGWFYPGDLGRLSDDGLLMVDGRVDDLMNFAGFKVLPALVEEAVSTCAGVVESVAFAAPDERGLNRCWLAIVSDDGFDPDTLAPAIRRVISRPPPIHWITLSKLPRNAMGKVQRDRLRALIAERQEKERQGAAS